MGRILVFGTEACPHCRRAKGALKARGIPYAEVDVAQYPQRRKEMSDLANRVSIPQVFFNDMHVGGADDLVKVLESWDKEQDKDALEIYQERIAAFPSPTDPRLALPVAQPEQPKETKPAVDTKDSIDIITIPDPAGKPVAVMDLFDKLNSIFDQQSRPYKAHWYKKSFVNTEAVQALAKEYPGMAKTQLVEWMQNLQKKYELIHHVCDDHIFRGDGYFFFRLQPYHQPEVLNSFINWGKVVGKSVNPSQSTDLILRLHKQLHSILDRHSDDNGLTDYIKVAADPDFIRFEFAACELQELDMGALDEITRKAFGMNLYNLFILYAFAKVGIGMNSLSRNAFFSRVQMNIGGNLLSFNDLENGVLRANTRHPYASKAPFLSSDDPRWSWSLAKLDCRLHFGLNCGAKSCPPIKFFNPETLEDELQLVSQAFCETDDAVLVLEGSQEIHLSMIFKWFQNDFAPSKDQLPKRVVQFLTGPKKEALQRMLDSKKPITIRFQAYDWSANASNFEAYNQSNLKANEYSATAMLRFQGHFDCMGATTGSSPPVSVSG